MRGHPLIAVASVFLGGATQILAQQPLVAEDFSFSQTGQFPPVGWVARSSGLPPEVWEEATVAFTGTVMHNLHTDAAGHEFGSAGVQCESWLIAPPLDLSNSTSANARFLTEYDWVNYMAHSSPSLGNGVSTLEVSLDLGSTWTPIWTAAPTATTVFAIENIDLAAWLGNSSVSLAWHYSGEYAHAWAIDDVYVGPNGSTTTPSLSLTGQCPGPGVVVGSGMTPGGPVRLYLTASAGSWVVPTGGCAGVILPATTPTLLPMMGTVTADPSGNFSLPGTMQSFHCGALIGAVDLATCTPTPLMRL